MGRVSEELKAVKEKKEGTEFPRENKDYYIQMHKSGETARPGWLVVKAKKSQFTREALLEGMQRNPAKHPQRCYRRLYFLYPGPKPDPKWGPVTP